MQSLESRRSVHIVLQENGKNSAALNPVIFWAEKGPRSCTRADNAVHSCWGRIYTPLGIISTLSFAEKAVILHCGGQDAMVSLSCDLGNQAS